MDSNQILHDQFFKKKFQRYLNEAATGNYRKAYYRKTKKTRKTVKRKLQAGKDTFNFIKSIREKYVKIFKYFLKVSVSWLFTKQSKERQ